jgi:hypothetical protein
MRILKEFEYLSRFTIAFGDSMQKVKLLRGVYRSGWKLLGVLYGYLRCCRRSMGILYVLTAAFRVIVASPSAGLDILEISGRITVFSNVIFST